MDILRGSSIILVMLLHSASILPKTGYVVNSTLFDINRYFILFRIPTLVFLSGLMLPRSLNKSAIYFAAGKLERIAWPLLVWIMIYIAVFDDVEFNTSTIIFQFKGGGYLWFLSFIFAYYTSAIVLRYIPPLLLSLTFLTVSFLPHEHTLSERFFYLAAIFYLASWVGTQRQYWQAAIQSLWTPLALAPAAYFAWVMLMSNDRNYGPANWLAGCCFVVGASALAYQFRYANVLKPLRFVGINSLSFYVAHYPLIYLIGKACHWNGIRSSLVVSFISLGLAFTVASILVVLSERYAVVRTLFVAPKVATDSFVSAATFAQRQFACSPLGRLASKFVVKTGGFTDQIHQPNA